MIIVLVDRSCVLFGLCSEIVLVSMSRSFLLVWWTCRGELMVFGLSL